MNVYFVDIHGNLLTYRRMAPDECRSMRPADGCDMLIRDERGFISSAKSSAYHETPKAALRAFVDKQNGYIAQTEDRLLREKQALYSALSILNQLPTASAEERCLFPSISKEM